jgi:hypothetical protein
MSDFIPDGILPSKHSPQALRIATKLGRIQDLLPYAQFLAWYMTTSLDDAELERQVDAKLEKLEGRHG